MTAAGMGDNERLHDIRVPPAGGTLPTTNEATVHVSISDFLDEQAVNHTIE